jgi:hypothetical protein
LLLRFFGKENTPKRALTKSPNVMLGSGTETEEITLTLSTKSPE